MLSMNLMACTGSMAMVRIIASSMSDLSPNLFCKVSPSLRDSAAFLAIRTFPSSAQVNSPSWMCVRNSSGGTFFGATSPVSGSRIPTYLLMTAGVSFPATLLDVYRYT
ncbi:hypothetical protein [Candidatus Methanoprimaticola sp. MG2]|uniref:hypothetical protein n=1 Tax=Candidatus Methanoprimaticola sp. MG2 TaxID=3228838 RepID=UPI0039C605BF